MDSEPDSINIDENKQVKNSDTMSDGRNVLSATRIRRSSTNHVETNRFIFDYHFIFLPIISLILWGIYVFI
jgi:hypothetical protein